MAFSIRKMFSNMNYFKKPGEDDCPTVVADFQNCVILDEASSNINFERIEPDSTSLQCATSLKLPESVKSYGIKKGSLSDTDINTLNQAQELNKDRKKNKKLKIDIVKANKSMNEAIENEDSTNNVENTPKHVLLESQMSSLFAERLKLFDLNRSFDTSDILSDTSDDGQMDLESLSNCSESDNSLGSDEKKSDIKMCRKVSINEPLDNQLVNATSLESFGDVELDKNEEERIKLILNYQMKLEKLDCFLTKLLTEFQFHVEVSKIFQCRSVVTPLPGTRVKNVQNLMGDVTLIDNINRGVSPTGSWNVVIEKEDKQTKLKLKKQLISMGQKIEEFINTSLLQETRNERPKLIHRTTYHVINGEHVSKKRLRISNKKKIKHFDFPDLSDAMTNLFMPVEDTETVTTVVDMKSDSDEYDTSKCNCKCHCSTLSDDSGLTSKSNGSSSVSITSSIGNFTLDSTMLSAYSDSLDKNISYNSFDDSSLYSLLLQKPAIERISFYVQVHSIQLKCEENDNCETKNVITFYCPSCKLTEKEEDSLLNHILSQMHCEKLHFVYKTAYVKRCIATGKELQPSTVLNPMKMYRDDNKIVCFGDAIYACSLCFVNTIIGESVLMAHCSDPEHIIRRERLGDILD